MAHDDPGDRGRRRAAPHTPETAGLERLRSWACLDADSVPHAVPNFSDTVVLGAARGTIRHAAGFGAAGLPRRSSVRQNHSPGLPHARSQLRQRRLPDVPRDHGDAHQLFGAIKDLPEFGDPDRELIVLNAVDASRDALHDIGALFDAIDAIEARLLGRVDLRLRLAFRRQRAAVVELQLDRATGAIAK